MFDGVHLGHAGVIAAAVKGAALDGGIPAVLTFRTHPLARVRPESKFPSLEELKSQLARDAAHAAEALEEGE